MGVTVGGESSPLSLQLTWNLASTLVPSATPSASSPIPPSAALRRLALLEKSNTSRSEALTRSATVAATVAVPILFARAYGSCTLKLHDAALSAQEVVPLAKAPAPPVPQVKRSAVAPGILVSHTASNTLPHTRQGIP